MKNSQFLKLGNSGNLLLELMIVVALTVTVSSFGARMLGEHRELTQDLDEKNEAILANDSQSWSEKVNEIVPQADGTMLALTVVERKW